MGFVALLLLGLASFGAMVFLGLSRLLWSSVGAALCAGAIGYAWQGRPLLAAVPAHPASTLAAVDPAEIALRDGMFGRYNADTAYLVAADAMTRTGNSDAAARVVMGGLSRIPQSFILWTWAGVTLSAAAGDQVSPPALLAFRQAARLAPEHPAPFYYLGMSYLRAGQWADARRQWLKALSLAPAGTDYRREIGLRIVLLDRFIAADPR